MGLASLLITQCTCSRQDPARTTAEPPKPEARGEAAQAAEQEGDAAKQFRLGPTPIWLVVGQRQTQAIPGSFGMLQVGLRDITGGQVRVRVGLSGTEAWVGSVLASRSLREGDCVDFDWEGQRYYLGVVSLVNFLIGEDFAELRISTEREGATSRLVPPDPVEPVQREGLPPMLEVAPGIYFGEKPNAEAFAGMAAMGVRSILSLGGKHDYAASAGDAGLELVRVPFAALSPSEEDLAHFLRVVTDPERLQQGGIYVCGSETRLQGAIALGVYRVLVRDWSQGQALAELLRPEHTHLQAWAHVAKAIARTDASQLRKAARRPPAPPPTAPPRWLGDLYRGVPGFNAAIVRVAPKVVDDFPQEIREFMRENERYRTSALEMTGLRVERVLWSSTDRDLRRSQELPPKLTPGKMLDVWGFFTIQNRYGLPWIPLKDERYRVLVRFQYRRFGGGWRTVALHPEKLE